MPMNFLRVAIPSPLRRLFDYLPVELDDGYQYIPGIRVIAPFGNRELVALLVEVSEQSDVDTKKLKGNQEQKKCQEQTRTEDLG